MAARKPRAKAPKFSIATTAGAFRLGDQGAQSLVVYFYPRDNTPGCTLEGRTFATWHRAFAARAPGSSASRPTRSNRTGSSVTR